MALIKCPECNNDVSENAAKCIKCGYPIKDLVKCQECGTYNAGKPAACAKCGAPLKPAAPAARARRDAPTRDAAAEPESTVPKSAYSDFEDEGPRLVSDKWAWALAFAPMMGMVLIVIIASIFPLDSENVWFVVAIFMCLNTVFMLLDMSELKEKRHSISGLMWLGLALAPVYLFFRSATVNKKYGYSIAWCVVFVLVVIFDYAVSTGGIVLPGGGVGGSSAYYVTDPRDGKGYGTVQIGAYTWMAKNLNHETGESWCYENNDSYCARYGRLYTWDAAMRACPSGWYLPGKQEWDNLMMVAGGRSGVDENEDAYYIAVASKLKSENGWDNGRGTNGDGTNHYGFAALPGGYRSANGDYSVVGDNGYFWSAQEYSANEAYFRGMYYDNDLVYDRYRVKGGGRSVRCVKESTAKGGGAPVSGPAPAARDGSGSLTDARDGKKYRVATVGGKAWMAENLNYKTNNAYCYDDEDPYCAKYGSLYNWKTAKSVCPSGWHLPSRTEWNGLVQAAGGVNAGGKKLKSKSGWSNTNVSDNADGSTTTTRIDNGNGTDNHGFSALPGGVYSYYDSGEGWGEGYYDAVGWKGAWWSSTESGSNAYYRLMSSDEESVSEEEGIKEYNWLSVRCIKD